MAAIPSEPETTPEDYRQRALLLADLGRYDEAAGEIAAGLSTAPADAALLATLARVHLAADQPAEALVAAERAGVADPDSLNPMVVRAMALTDSHRYTDAALVATGILRRFPGDAYAQRTGAALLSESRNGQEALNAAWQAVRVAPDEAEAHLVLAVVAARLQLFELAQRAYAEALDLDPAIGDAQHDTGVIRLERRRWAQALELLASDAVVDEPPQATAPGTYPSPFPRAYRLPDAADAATVDGPDEDAGPPRRRTSDRADVRPFRPEVIRPAGPVLDPSADSAYVVRQAVLYGATGTLAVATLSAFMTLASPGVARVWAITFGCLVFLAVLIGLTRRLREPVATVLSRLRRTDRKLAGAAWTTFLAPLVIVGFGLTGSFAVLVAAIAMAAAAELLGLSPTDRSAGR